MLRAAKPYALNHPIDATITMNSINTWMATYQLGTENKRIQQRSKVCHCLPVQPELIKLLNTLTIESKARLTVAICQGSGSADWADYGRVGTICKLVKVFCICLQSCSLDFNSKINIIAGKRFAGVYGIPRNIARSANFVGHAYGYILVG